MNVLYDTRPINLGYTRLVAQLSLPRDLPHRRPELTLFEGSIIEEGAHTPACSITVYGEDSLKALRDALIEAFPLSGSAA